MAVSSETGGTPARRRLLRPRPLSPPSSPLRKRVLSVPSPSSLIPDPDTRSIPSLTDCHCCGDGGDLRLLPSRWRVALLCSACLSAVRSAEICSYCFAGFSSEGGGVRDLFLNCLRCLRRVHYACIPHHRYYLSPSQLDPASFTCVDCCPVPNPRCNAYAVAAEALRPLGLGDHDN